jgi:hypothetical protein
MNSNGSRQVEKDLLPEMAIVSNDQVFKTSSYPMNGQPRLNVTIPADTSPKVPQQSLYAGLIQLPNESHDFFKAKKKTEEPSTLYIEPHSCVY